jgi:hypothetical protein
MLGFLFYFRTLTHQTPISFLLRNNRFILLPHGIQLLLQVLNPIVQRLPLVGQLFIQETQLAELCDLLLELLGQVVGVLDALLIVRWIELEY